MLRSGLFWLVLFVFVVGFVVFVFLVCVLCFFCVVRSVCRGLLLGSCCIWVVLVCIFFVRGLVLRSCMLWLFLGFLVRVFWRRSTFWGRCGVSFFGILFRRRVGVCVSCFCLGGVLVCCRLLGVLLRRCSCLLRGVFLVCFCCMGFFLCVGFLLLLRVF